MNTNDKVFGAIEFFFWILFTCAILYSLRNPTNIFLSAIIIVILGYAAAIACPMIRQSNSFQKVYKRK